jgi:hypothetical protein
MTQLRCILTLLLLVVGLTIPAYAQKEKAFPTDEEIRLVLTQTDRAIQQYKPLIDQQETQLTGVKEAAANDRKVVAALEIAVKAFREKPQAFNGPLGFLRLPNAEPMKERSPHGRILHSDTACRAGAAALHR